MIDLAIIVEGQTEEAFVNQVLAPHLAVLGIAAWPVLPGKGRARRGGRHAWESVRKDAARLLKERQDRRCALMFDYYGLPHDWPGRDTAPSRPIDERGRFVEKSLATAFREHEASSFGKARFLPHIQLHEFEARLFSDCSALAAVVGGPADALERIVAECGAPERIDDGLETAPSKRLEALRPGYQKIAMGVSASQRIGLALMREKCPHFDAWLTRLEAMAEPSA